MPDNQIRKNLLSWHLVKTIVDNFVRSSLAFRGNETELSTAAERGHGRRGYAELF